MALAFDTIQNEQDLPNNRMKRLQKALIASLAVNLVIVLVGVFAWQQSGLLLLNKAQFQPNQEVASNSAPTDLSQLVCQLKEKRLDELYALLRDSGPVSHGFDMRSCALAALCAYHDFNIQKALPSTLAPKEEKVLSISGKPVTFYPGLSNEHFLALHHFIQQEAFPFTTEGIYKRLQQNGSTEGLRAAFSLTGHYVVAEELLRRAGAISQQEVVDLLLSGSFSTLEKFYAAQREKSDFSPGVRQKFLQSYLAQSSPVAAQLLVRFDKDFSVHKLSDSEVMEVAKLVESVPATEQDYCLTLLQTERSQKVQQYARNLLVKAAPDGKNLGKLSRKELLAHFSRKAVFDDKKQVVAQAAQVKKEKAPAFHDKKMAVTSCAAQTSKQVKARDYVVQNGDNLWRISKKFQVQVETIKVANNLKNDALKPGAVLRIPY